MQSDAKSVVVTGASSGIGHASVLRMSEAGWHVFASVRKTSDQEKLRKIPGVVPILMDVEDRSSIASAAEQVASQVRGLDGLVNVAGIGMLRPIEYASDQDIRQIFEINLFGQIAVTQAFLPLLRKGHGRIVNITSVGAHIAIPFGALLNASKSAFGIVSDNLRLELRTFGIRVSTIEPGSIATPAVNKTLGDMDRVIESLPEEAREQYGEMMKQVARRGYEREMNGSDPDVVAVAVRHALTTARPRIRYRVGKDATLIATLAKVLPDSLLDLVRLKALGLPTAFGSVEENVRLGSRERSRRLRLEPRRG